MVKTDHDVLRTIDVQRNNKEGVKALNKVVDLKVKVPDGMTIQDAMYVKS